MAPFDIYGFYKSFEHKFFRLNLNTFDLRIKCISSNCIVIVSQMNLVQLKVGNLISGSIVNISLH